MVATGSAAWGEPTTTGPAVLVHNCGGDLTPEDLTNRTPEELRRLAQERGYEPHGQPDQEGNFRKFRDPVTREQRLRIDAGHVDDDTGLPYDDPRAAVPHAHGYLPGGAKVRDPESGNPHFPLRQDG